MTRSRFILFQFAALTAISYWLAGGLCFAQEVVLQSTPLGTIGHDSGTSITAVHFSGWRFTIDKPLAVASVGGHMLTNIFQEGDIFAALVSLDSIGSFPHGSPFAAEEVVATTTFLPPFPSDEVSTPLSATLAPGSYALVFGSGLFGATGEGMLPLLDDQQDIPPTNISSYIFWSIPFFEQPPIWRTNLAQRMRFVVAGEVIHLPGDYNVDGKVDAQDYDAWSTEFGATGPNDADGSGDAVVDAADYTIWRNHLGERIASGAAALGVPEPATAAMVVPAAAVWCVVGCRIRRSATKLRR